jgi:hypothetical protein
MNIYFVTARFCDILNGNLHNNLHVSKLNNSLIVIDVYIFYLRFIN